MAELLNLFSIYYVHTLYREDASKEWDPIPLNASLGQKDRLACAASATDQQKWKVLTKLKLKSCQVG